LSALEAAVTAAVAAQADQLAKAVEVSAVGHSNPKTG